MMKKSKQRPPQPPMEMISEQTYSNNQMGSTIPCHEPKKGNLRVPSYIST